MTKLPEQYVALSQVVGSQLSSVEFVQDYFQLRFDGPTVNVTSDRTTVHCEDNQSVSWDNHFRNMICGQICKIVKSVELVPYEDLCFLFEDGSEIDVSLRPEDNSTPEAIYFHGFENGEWGIA
jgi:hypothetical protein